LVPNGFTVSKCFGAASNSTTHSALDQAVIRKHDSAFRISIGLQLIHIETKKILSLKPMLHCLFRWILLNNKSLRQTIRNLFRIAELTLIESSPGNFLKWAKSWGRKIINISLFHHHQCEQRITIIGLSYTVSFVYSQQALVQTGFRITPANIIPFIIVLILRINSSFSVSFFYKLRGVPKLINILIPFCTF
jgi:hypothetical protein